MTNQEYYGRKYIEELYESIFKKTGKRHEVKEKIARVLNIEPKELENARGKEEVVNSIMKYQNRLIQERSKGLENKSLNSSTNSE